MSRWATGPPSSRQHFVALEFDYPSAQLIRFAQMTRNLKGSGLEEGASTRLLVHAAKLITTGVSPVVVCSSCIAEALTDGAEMLTAVHVLGAGVFR